MNRFTTFVEHQNSFMEEGQKNSIDAAIEICDKKSKQHQNQSGFFLVILILVTIAFAFFVLGVFSKEENEKVRIDVLTKATQNNLNTHKIESELFSMLQKLNDGTNDIAFSFNEVKTTKDLDLLMLKVEKEREFINEFNNKLLNIRYSIDTNAVKTRKISQEILGLNQIQEEPNTVAPYLYFASFVVLFGFVASFYRHHLKEASKFEQFHIGFIRIRIAGNNSSSGFEDLVKESLTKDAFHFETNRKRVESPLPGHPTSEITTNILNKILDNFEIKQKVKP